MYHYSIIRTEPVQALKMLHPLSFPEPSSTACEGEQRGSAKCSQRYSDLRYPRPVSHPDTEMHVPPFDPICKAVHELSSNTAACKCVSVGAS